MWPISHKPKTFISLHPHVLYHASSQRMELSVQLSLSDLWEMDDHEHLLHAKVSANNNFVVVH